MGNTESILKAMKESPYTPKVQEDGCKKLYNLCAKSSSYRKSIREHQGIEVIVKAMKNHVNKKEVQRVALLTLQTLAINRENQAAIANAGGVEVLFHTMEKYYNDSTIQEESCATIVNLSVDNDANKRKISNCGGIIIIINAMKYHTGSDRVQEEACRALWTLAYKNDPIKLAIANSGGVEAINNAMSNHPEKDRVQKFGRYAKKGIRRYSRSTVSFDNIERLQSSKEMEDALSDLEASLLCIVCRENRKGALILPCRHLCLCPQCSQQFTFKDCPICRQKVDQIMNVYL